MREIKFRGYNGEKWLFGNLDIDYKAKHACISDNRFWRHPVRFDTVGQFTGMYDAEGREIYEGDIVKATLKEPSFMKRFKLQNEIVGEMLFDNAWWIKERETINLIPPWRLRYYDLTVIGNAHDNPNLLEADDARD